MASLVFDFACKISPMAVRQEIPVAARILAQEIVSGISIGYGFYEKEWGLVAFGGIILISGVSVIRVRDKIEKAKNIPKKRLK